MRFFLEETPDLIKLPLVLHPVKKPDVHPLRRGCGQGNPNPRSNFILNVKRCLQPRFS